MTSTPRSQPGKSDPYASRWLRLGGAVIDGLIFIPLALAFNLLPDWNAIATSWSVDAEVLQRTSAILFGITCFVLIQGWAIYTRGQTIGKIVCGTVVVTKDGRQVSGNRYLFGRILPIGCIGLLWFINAPLELIVTPLVGLADKFAIFRREKNRLIDDLAGTRVIMKADLKTTSDGKAACSHIAFHRKNATIQEQLEYLRDGLRDHDIQTCGNAPKWICNLIREQLEAVLAKSSEPSFDDDAKDFIENAKRYVAENGDQDCKQLKKTLAELVI